MRSAVLPSAEPELSHPQPAKQSCHPQPGWEPAAGQCHAEHLYVTAAADGASGATSAASSYLP